MIFKSVNDIFGITFLGIIIFIIFALIASIFSSWLVFFGLVFFEVLVLYWMTEYGVFYYDFFVIKKINGGRKKDYDSVIKVVLVGIGNIRFESYPGLVFFFSDGSQIKFLVKDDKNLINFLSFLKNEKKIRVFKNTN